MHPLILTHTKYIEAQLEKPLSENERHALLSYHTMRVHDFQHERLVHLLVTLFFGFLLVGTVAALLAQPLSELVMPLGILSIILLVLEIAYIRYYYVLENSVQSLYPLTEQLQNTLSSNNSDAA